jgi:hypothetical protein
MRGLDAPECPKRKFEIPLKLSAQGRCNAGHPGDLSGVANTTARAPMTLQILLMLKMV